MAEDVGATYGQTLAAGLTGDALAAGQRSLRSAMQAVAAALTAHGFAARTSEPALVGGRRAGDGLRIISDHCPFGNVAIEHPVLCAVDRGMVRGMLGVLYPSAGTARRRHRRVEGPRRHALRDSRVTVSPSLRVAPSSGDLRAGASATRLSPKRWLLTRTLRAVDVRIGVTQAPREINVEVDDGERAADREVRRGGPRRRRRHPVAHRQARPADRRAGRRRSPTSRSAPPTATAASASGLDLSQTCADRAWPDRADAARSAADLRHRQGGRRQDVGRRRPRLPRRRRRASARSCARWTPRVRSPLPSTSRRWSSRRAASTTISRRWR